MLEELIEKHKIIHENNVAELVVSAPGVVSLIGEHTESSKGLVLGFASSQRNYLAISKSKDYNLICGFLKKKSKKKSRMQNLKFKEADKEFNYIKGVAHEFINLGYKINGMNITLADNIWKMSGLSSSTAIILSFTIAIKEVFKLKISKKEILNICYSVERNFLNRIPREANYLIGLYASENKIMQVDLQDYSYKEVVFKSDNLDFLITNSGIKSSYNINEINLREKANSLCISFFKSKFDNRNFLREFSESEIQNNLNLKNEYKKFCIHITYDIHKVLEGFQVLKNKDYKEFGKILHSSHESLRDFFESSCPEIDWLIKRSLDNKGVLGARMIGYGFGGSIVTLIDKNSIQFYKNDIKSYFRIFGFYPKILKTQPSSALIIHKL